MTYPTPYANFTQSMRKQPLSSLRSLPSHALQISIPHTRVKGGTLKNLKKQDIALGEKTRL